MNASGSAATLITGDFSGPLSQLDYACHDWLSTESAKKIAQAPKDREYTKREPEKAKAKEKRLKLNSDIKAGHVHYHTTSTAVEKTIVKSRFCLTTKQGACNLFNATKRKDAIPQAFREYFNDSLEFVKQGNSNLGLSHMFQSWSMSGFGMWAHIVPGFGLEVHMDFCKLMQSNGFNWTPRQPPHLIHKPPGGSKLEVHHDGIPTKKLMNELAIHAISDDPTWISWSRQKHPPQNLAHIDGGHTGDGSTFVIAMSSPEHQSLAMRLIKEELIKGAFHIDPAQNHLKTLEWYASTSGPYFVPRITTIIPEMNKILVPMGFPEIYVKNITPGMAGPFIASWALGMWHGSKPSTNRRISLTLPSGPQNDIASAPIYSRSIAIAIIASSNEDIQSAIDAGTFATTPDATVASIRANAEKTVDDHKTPLADGSTHERPEMAGDRIRHPDGVGPNRMRGYFQPIAPSINDVIKFYEDATNPLPW